MSSIPELKWKPIADALLAYEDESLRPCQVILTFHEDDLYPVCAYLMPGTDVWYRAIEGPEDIDINGSNEPLFRAPTHWKQVPLSPKVERGIMDFMSK